MLLVSLRTCLPKAKGFTPFQLCVLNPKMVARARRLRYQCESGETPHTGSTQLDLGLEVIVQKVPMKLNGSERKSRPKWCPKWCPHQATLWRGLAPFPYSPGCLVALEPPELRWWWMAPHHEPLATIEGNLAGGIKIHIYIHIFYYMFT